MANQERQNSTNGLGLTPMDERNCPDGFTYEFSASFKSSMPLVKDCVTRFQNLDADNFAYFTKFSNFATMIIVSSGIYSAVIPDGANKGCFVAYYMAASESGLRPMYLKESTWSNIVNDTVEKGNRPSIYLD